ncbi:MAG: Stk1 family PASTA domain-containing Ser/Thr kinase [Candidatus Nanopelagicales bacterium]
MSETRKLANRYELGEPIGRGGMADVFEAFDTRLNRTVAIKILRSDLAHDPAFIARFRKEAQAAAALNHPTIVAVYDTGEDIYGEGRSATNVPYIVMEYVDGTTLRDIIKSGRKLPPERGLRIIAGVLDALAYSHRHGIIHRDIKPANIMIARSGEVKVMDFGIARALADASNTMTGGQTVMGTAQYLSPEQAKGEAVDARSDLYSAGVLLYELLTGKPPFSGESPVAIAYQHVSEIPTYPSEIDPAIPKSVDSVVMHALNKSAKDRYQSAEEFQADVERIMAGIPISKESQPKPKPQPVSKTTAPVRTKTRGTSVLVLLALAGVFVGGVTVWLAMQIFGFDANSRTIVPSLEGLTVERATVLLQDEGLILGQITPENSERPEGTVISQSPNTGVEVTPGQIVNVTISAGVSRVTVPRLIGLISVDDARRVLADVGLRLGPVTEADSEQNAGVVLGSNPPEGTAVEAGTQVALTVSSGLKVVPQVVGLTEAQAITDLTNLGFAVEVLQQVGLPEQIGLVIAQAPKPGTKAKFDSLVTISVAVSAEELPPPLPEEPVVEGTG